MRVIGFRLDVQGNLRRSAEALTVRTWKADFIQEARDILIGYCRITGVSVQEGENIPT